VQGIGEYSGDIAAGADKAQTRRRVLKATAGRILEDAGKTMRGGRSRMGRGRSAGKRAASRSSSGPAPKRQRKCCRVKVIRNPTGGAKRRRRQPQKKSASVKRAAAGSRGRKPIKGRTKFDLFSV